MTKYRLTTVDTETRGQRVAAIALTFNEERHVAECLASLDWCDEVWVVDSLSTDQTVELCHEYKCRVVQHPFEGFSAQRQWALDNLPMDCEWVLFVDADERVSPALAREIKKRIGSDSFNGYHVPVRQLFWGKHLRFGQCTPHVLRLHRRGTGRYLPREIHEILQVEGPLGHLTEPLDHVCRESMTELIEKLNRYSTLDALRMYRTGQELFTTQSSSYCNRNAYLKAVFERLPLKPVCKFIYDYFICQGFRDGPLGFTMALMQSLYVYLCYFKLWELRKDLVQSETMPQTEEAEKLAA